MVTEVLKSRV